jgi:hypothetical protein
MVVFIEGKCYWEWKGLGTLKYSGSCNSSGVCSFVSRKFAVLLSISLLAFLACGDVYRRNAITPNKMNFISNKSFRKVIKNLEGLTH